MIISSSMDTPLYSVRMRASCQGQHLAGAERIVSGAAVSGVTAAMVARAMNCANGKAEEIHCSVERIASAVRFEQLPDVSTYIVNNWLAGRQLAGNLLFRAGVEKDVASRAILMLANGAGTGGSVMRGAVIMDAETGERLEKDPSRGVRVSRMDLSPECRAVLMRELASAGLGHHRVLEALVLAGKVLRAPGIVAELCWSDDPNYTTGYVAAPKGGYQRISALKPIGDSSGGRVFFVNRSHVSPEGFINYMERQAVLFNALGVISPPGKWVATDG